MARAGGQSTATGVSFQGLAIARAIIDAHQGRIDFVRAEVPPHADFGHGESMRVEVDDFVIQRSGVRVYHQAKSNAPGGGSWTINKLCEEDILQKFALQTAADANCECCLVTPSDCLLLGEIADRVREAASDSEFLTNLTDRHRQEVDSACDKLAMDRVGLCGFLRRCKLQRRTSENFREELQSLASVLFADPNAASDCLHIMAIRAMESGQALNRTSIEAIFCKNSVFAKPKATEAELLSAMKGASSRLRTVGRDIAGVYVPQPTVDKLLEWAVKRDPAGPSVAALLDQAGSGKTVAMSVLLDRLENAGFAVLAIKADGLSFSSQEELASAIGVPDSIPSTLQSLKVNGHKIAMLIDQVDALSSAMSRESSGITAVLDLVARVAHLGVPIVLACRSFDWKYDHRLGHLRDGNPAEFALPELADDHLAQVLSVCSVKAADLHPVTAKVVRCPLRLKMLVDVIRARRQEEPSWAPETAVYTLQSLYQDFWSLKMGKALADGVVVTDCEAVAEKLAQAMHDSECLSAPEVCVADLRGARDWLISEGVLTMHGKVLSFFHQTFFDFIFARWFVRSDQSLVVHLKESDQGLFYRPMVRQILEYLRDCAQQRYRVELKGILEDAGIRRHLRWLAVAWLGQHADPRLEELDLLEPMLARHDNRRRVLASLSGNVAWFDMLTAQRLDRWLLTLPEDEIWPIVWYLHSAVPERQEETTSLLSPHVGKSASWNDQIAFCLAGIKTGWASCSAGLLLALLSDPLTNLDEHGWWASALESLAKSSPARACEGVGSILRRFTARWAVSDQDGADSVVPRLRAEPHRLPSAHDFLNALNVLADTAPEPFLGEVLPWTVAVMQTSCYTYVPGGFKDNWRYWTLDHHLQDNPSGKLLAAIGTGATKLAKTNPAVLRRLVPQFLAIQCLPMQVIVAKAYEEAPAVFATDAAEFLSADARRLRISSGGSICWRATQLMRACCPHWSHEAFERVESAILTMAYYPAKTADGLRWRGRTHLYLLQSLDRKRLSDVGLNLLGQLERKFPGHRPTPPQDYELHRADAPIKLESVKKMDDDNWLGAMLRHFKGWESRSFPDERESGRDELSRSLQASAKEQPERFLQLAMERMDGQFHVDYIQAIISGIAEAGIPVESVEGLIRKFGPLLKKEIRTVAWAIEKYADKGLTQYMYDLLKSWVTQAPDPVPVAKDGGSEVDAATQHDDDCVLTRGMTTDRGAALSSIAAVLLKANPPRRAEYLDIAESVIIDPSAAVRAVCIQFLQYAISADPVRACGFFRRLVGNDTQLLRERGAYDFVYCSLHRHANETLWAIMVMLADTRHPKSQEAGARLACLAAFEGSAVAAALRDLCINGGVPVRKGAAAVYSANAVEPQVGEECRMRLQVLMNDEDESVRREATGFLRDLDAPCLREMGDFLRLWTATKSLKEGAENAACMLEHNPVVIPELTMDIAERLVNMVEQEIANKQSRHGMITYRLTPAILNVYHRSSIPATKRRAIDLFERLEELGCPEVKAAMESADRL